MSFASIANNQCVSCNNLQDATVNPPFYALAFPSNPIPVSTKQITKQEFEDYILGPLSISYPTIAAYPPFANKTTNQLVVKGDIYTTGTITMEPAYGIYFTSSTNGNLAAFSYPVTTISTINYDFQVYADNGSGFGFELYIDGTISSPSSYAHITIYSNDQIVDQSDIFAPSGPQYVLLSFPYDIYAPSSIRVVVEDGGINNGVVDVKFPISSVAVSRTTGQYQVVASAKVVPQQESVDYLQGYIYRSIDYGVNFQKVGGQQSTLVGYWQSIAISDTGQYIVAGELYGKLIFSSNYGASFTDITSNIPSCDYPNPLAISNVSISGDGEHIIVCLFPSLCSASSPTSRSYLSNNFGASFALAIDEDEQNEQNSFLVSEINSDGSLMVVSSQNGIFKSTNNGASWTAVTFGAQGISKRGISMVSSGSVIGLIGTDIYTSTNSGSSFSTFVASAYRGIAVFNNGSNRFYTLYYSANTVYPIYQSGASFATPLTAVSGPGNKQWWAISASDNGQYVLAGTCNYSSGNNNTNELWRSNNGGSSWIKI
jgi:hypothetical protein